MSSGTQALMLADFLLARIAEDEAVVSRPNYDPPDFGTFGDGYSVYGDSAYHNPYLTIDPKRILAECEAKRKIIARCSTAAEGADWETGYEHGTSDALADLAAVYSDHPDYREEWK